MNAGPWFAASGTLTLHVLMLGAALTLVGQQAVRELARPVEVVLLAPPPRPPAPPAPEPPRAAPAPAVQPEPAKPAEPRTETLRPKPKPREARATPARQAPRAPIPEQLAALPKTVPLAVPAAPAPLEPPRPAAIAPPAVVAPPAEIAASPDPAPSASEGSALPWAARAPAAAAARPSPAPVAEAPPSRTTPRFDASWVGNAPPPYPPIARRLGEQGEVRLDVHVGPSGKVLDVRLKRSSGSPVLDQTAIETVKKWRFRPATVDGQPVAEWYHDWKWVFKLES